MEKLAAYYRSLYPTNFNGNDTIEKANALKTNSHKPTIAQPPEYPQLCKICDDEGNVLSTPNLD